MRALFVCSTTEGWIDIMHSGLDVTEVYQAPMRDNEFHNCVFFMTFIIFGSFFVTNIFIGVLVNFFGESSGAALLTDRQKEWLQTQVLCLSTPVTEIDVPESGFRLQMYNVVTHWIFDNFVMVAIMANIIILMIEHVPMDEDLATLLGQVNFVFLIIFTLEMLIRIVAVGPLNYIKDNWMKLDGFIVITAWVTLFAETMQGLQAIRALRVLRILMLLKNAKTLRSLFSTMILSLPAAANLCCLLFLVFFIYGIIGMQFFGARPHGEFINDEDNFENIGNAMKFLFQISTGQDFMNVVYELEGYEPNRWLSVVFVYFCSFIIASIWVFFNLFVAVLLENFENNFTAAEMELSVWHIAHFKSMWMERTVGPKHESMGLKQLKDIVPRLHDPLSRIVTLDENWFNRILFEMDVNFTGDLDEVTVGFHETLLALCLVYQSYDGLTFDQQQRKRDRIIRTKEAHATRVLMWHIRIYLRSRNPPPEYETEDQKRAYRAALKCIRLLLLDSMVRTGKIIAATVQV